MQHCTISSAMSVSRSLTCINGSRWVKSASATETCDLLEDRSASTSLGSSGRSRSCARPARARTGRAGSSSNAFGRSARRSATEVGDLTRQKAADCADIDEPIERAGSS